MSRSRLNELLAELEDAAIDRHDAESGGTLRVKAHAQARWEGIRADLFALYAETHRPQRAEVRELETRRDLLIGSALRYCACMGEFMDSDNPNAAPQACSEYLDHLFVAQENFRAAEAAEWASRQGGPTGSGEPGPPGTPEGQP